MSTRLPVTQDHNPKRHPGRIAFSVFGTLVLLVAAMLMLNSLDEPNGAQHVEILKPFLTWPVLGFAVLLVFILIFQPEVSYLIRNIKRAQVGGASVETHQADVPPSHEAINLPSIEELTEAIDERLDSVKSDPEDLKEKIEARLRIAELEQEAELWWHRYLVAFLSPLTLNIFRAIPHMTGMTRYGGDFVDVPEVRLLLRDGNALPATEEAFHQAIRALERYGLIRPTGPKQWSLTEVGGKFLTYLTTQDAKDLIGELREGEQVNRYKQILGGY